MSEGSGSSMKLGLWLTFAAFLVIVIVFRSNLKELQFGSEGVKATLVSPQDVQGLSEADRKSSEQELLQRVNSLEKKVRSEPATRKIEREIQAGQSAIPNLAGNWKGASGLVYVINQFGNSVSIQEVNPMLGGVTAAATGQISGPDFSLPAYTLAGTTGVLRLQVSDDGNRMSGDYRDSVSGMVVPMQLSR